MQDAIEDKLAVNEARVYRKLANGLHVKEPGGGISVDGHQS